MTTNKLRQELERLDDSVFEKRDTQWKDPDVPLVDPHPDYRSGAENHLLSVVRSMKKLALEALDEIDRLTSETGDTK